MIVHSSLDADLVNILRDYANELIGACNKFFPTFYSRGFFDLSRGVGIWGLAVYPVTAKK